MLEDARAVIDELFSSMKDRTYDLVARAQQNTEKRVRYEMTLELNRLQEEIRRLRDRDLND